MSMWQQLGAEAGNQVLEVGTGTGYSTALGAHLLGDANLTSIEYDPQVAERAAAALKAAGHTPRLLTGDGLGGAPDGGAFDRLIATCSVRYLPMAWLHQVKPGRTRRLSASRSPRRASGSGSAPRTAPGGTCRSDPPPPQRRKSTRPTSRAVQGLRYDAADHQVEGDATT
ncbi:methyltransferase domain-containing protein [Streptomyces rubellomurinus]|uniref:methyltransferase domain-containing protein n=1 Tax=Streptomyces rubellomurinus (strain ATCC 31215) TaxID=359131 RepID=UPI001FC96C94|nr:methyltransferase domain-containing protein [Streptomyces rubellomurinus]